MLHVSQAAGPRQPRRCGAGGRLPASCLRLLASLPPILLFSSLRASIHSGLCLCRSPNALLRGGAAPARMVVLGGVLEERSGLGLGCMSVSGQYDNGVPLPPDEALRFFRGVHKAGCRHFDTAEVYKSGPFSLGGVTADTVFNETQLGSFFATVPRDSFTVATKYMPSLREGRSDYAAVKGALVDSLGRLGLDYVDVYYSHRVVSRDQAVEFTQSVQRLVEEGLVRSIGLSEVSAAWLRAAHTVAPVSVIQQEWSLLTRGIEEELVPTCLELGIGIVAYSPLARNLLAAPKERPTDQRRKSIPRFAEENFEENQKMLARLEALAQAKAVSTAQLSMAWLMHKARELGVQCLPIPGTKTLSHALDNIASAQITLASEDMALLEEIGAMVVGERESESYRSASLEGNPEKASLEESGAKL